MTELFIWTGFVGLTVVVVLAISEYIETPKHKRKKIKFLCNHDMRFFSQLDDRVTYVCRKCGKLKHFIEEVKENEQSNETN